MTLIVLALDHSGAEEVMKQASGSLIPAMAIHVLIDLGAGYMTWIALRDADVLESTPLPVGPT